MGARVFHHPLQSVYMSGLKCELAVLALLLFPLQSVYMSGLKYGHNNVIPTRGACNPCM